MDRIVQRSVGVAMEMNNATILTVPVQTDVTEDIRETVAPKARILISLKTLSLRKKILNQ